MTPADLDLAAALRQIFRHPLLRSVLLQLIEEALASRADARVEGFIGTGEAARRAGVKPDAILEWISRGILPATRPQGTKQWRILPANLEAVMSEKAGQLPVDLSSERARRLASSIKREGPK